ncbi:DMT family transporter [Ramlibacter sp.]|uniref:DMT family transporter n=1 Tax=Ramlibacter sp. TaxID=1917967 RepID=UPI002C2FEF8B|nr:DMT family transporter [Ramlibacter sp.]HWI84316.1 DMT family transporter [Ramlibacter sp.]
MTTHAADALHAANRRGVLAISVGMASFVANDALVKHVSETLPASQLIFLRGLMASLLLLAIGRAMGATRRLADLLDRRVMTRAGLDSLGTVTYLLSLFHIPLADATAINMATPLVITLLAVIAFREQVHAVRWLALAVGFTGVLLVVQPRGAEFSGYSLLCLGGTLFHATRDFATRLIDRTIPSVLITLSTAIAVTAFAGVWSLFQEWAPVQPVQLALLAAASVFLSGGYFLLTVAMRAGEMSLIAPFRYSGLLFALVLGYAVWGHVPNAWAWLGIALLLGAGLWLMRAPAAR